MDKTKKGSWAVANWRSDKWYGQVELAECLVSTRPRHRLGVVTLTAVSDMRLGNHELQHAS